MKKKLNTLIEVVNAKQSSQRLKKLEGHYETGSLYGNPKKSQDLVCPPLKADHIANLYSVL